MAKYITEILKEINDDVSSIRKYHGNQAIKCIAEYAFDPDKKFILPDNDPPYKKDAAPLGMSPVNLYQELRRFYIYCRADIKPIRRESQFIQLLENIHPLEAELMLAIKDQNINKLYQNITFDLLLENGFLTNEIADKIISLDIPKQQPMLIPQDKVPGDISADEDNEPSAEKKAEKVLPPKKVKVAKVGKKV